MIIEHFTTFGDNLILVDQYRDHTVLFGFLSEKNNVAFKNTIGKWNIKYKEL